MFRPYGESLSLACPRESDQREGHPHIRSPDHKRRGLVPSSFHGFLRTAFTALSLARLCSFCHPRQNVLKTCHSSARSRGNCRARHESVIAPLSWLRQPAVFRASGRDGQMSFALVTGCHTQSVPVKKQTVAEGTCPQDRPAHMGVSFLFVPFLWISKEKGPAIRRNLNSNQIAFGLRHEGQREQCIIVIEI